MTMGKYLNTFFVMYANKYNGNYYGSGLATDVATFFSCEFGTGGKDHGKYGVEYNLDAAPTQVRTGNNGMATVPTTWNADAYYGPSSGHPNVINCLFGDGSVRGVRKDVDAQALFQAVTRNNQDPDATDHL
jgi:prepilin-type processing-associated H-X9-DG protein